MKYFVNIDCAGCGVDGGPLEGVEAGVVAAAGAVAEFVGVELGAELGAAVGALRFVASSTTMIMINTMSTPIAMLEITVRGFAGLMSKRYAV